MSTKRTTSWWPPAKLAGKAAGIGVIAAAILMVAGGVAHAQSAANAQPAAVPHQTWTVERAWGLIRGHYAGGPREELLTLAAGEGESARREVIRVGLDGSQNPPRFFLEFGGFRVVGARGQVSALHADAPGRYASARVASIEDLLAFMPGLPVPQIAAVLGSAENSGATREFTLGARFTEVIEEGTGDARRVVIRGSSAFGPAEIVADAASGRVLSLTGAVGGDSGPGGVLPVRVSFESVVPQEASKDGWTLDVTARRRVESIALLKPGPRAPSEGDSLRGVALSAGAEMKPFSIADEQSRAREAASGGVGVVLVVFKPDAGESAEQAEALKSAAMRLAEVRRLVRSDAADGIADVVPVFVGVVPITEFSRERVEAFETVWDAGAQSGERLWPRMAWAIGGGGLETLISRGKGGEPWIVVAGDDAVVRHIGRMSEVMQSGADGKRDDAALARALTGWMTSASRGESTPPAGRAEPKR